MGASNKSEAVHPPLCFLAPSPRSGMGEGSVLNSPATRFRLNSSFNRFSPVQDDCLTVHNRVDSEAQFGMLISCIASPSAALVSFNRVM